MKPIFLRPEQYLKEFLILRRPSRLNDIGRTIYDQKPIEIGTLKGTICNVKQKEMLRFKQLERPVTHTIVVRGICDAAEGDILVLEKDKYYIQEVEDPSKLGIFTVIYCEMRQGVGQYEGGK